MGRNLKKRISLLMAASMLAGMISPPALAASAEDKIEELGFGTYFNQLPKSDRSEITALLGGSYTDDDEFIAAYKEAWDSVVTLSARDSAELIIDEDFEDGIDSSWTKGGSPEVNNPETGGYGSLSLDGTEENALYVQGGKWGGGNTYIKNDFGERKAMVSLYFYETEWEWDNSAFGIRVSDDVTFGVYSTAENYSINIDGEWKSLGKERSEGWHRVIFDTLNQADMKIYLDGDEVYSGSGTISYLQAGNLWSIKGVDEWYVDEISVIGEKQMSWADKFNAQTLTEEALSEFLSENQRTVFEKLPQCDRTEIVNEIESGKPYDTQEEVLEKYADTLVKVTQYDSSKYELVFYEGFENGITSEWESEKKPAITKFLGNNLDSLNINGMEENSAIFWGAKVSANNGEAAVNGSNQTISRTVPENSYISLYFWDAMNDNSPYIGFKINDNLMSGSYGLKSYYMYSINGGSSWKNTTVAREKGWHKVVFDGVSEPGKVHAYLDGVEIFAEEGTTEILAIGNFWSNAGYSYYSVDNITVSRKFLPSATNVKINDNKSYISVSYDYSHTGALKEGETVFQWYKKNDSGEFEAIEGATQKEYYFNMPEDSQKTFRVSVTPADERGIQGDTVNSDEFTESYLTALKPDVKSVIIEGEASVNSTLSAVYTAENAGGSGAGADKYRWYISENGTEWTLLEGETKKNYKIGIEAIRMQIKCEVSVAGKEGAYSEWVESSNIITDSTSLVKMISAVKASEETGKNAIMLNLLKKCDSEFSSYSVSEQQKITVKVLTTSISNDADYRKLVEGILNGSIEVSTSGIDFTTKPTVISGTSMGDVEYTGFTDLESAAWAKPAILSLFSKKLISGRSETLFCPNDNVTRAEFTSMLVRSFYGVNNNAQNSFKDVKEGSWYEKYVATAFENGIVFGKGDKSFGPDDAITREEMAVLCSRIIQNGGCYVEDIREYTEFDDAESISEYAYDHVVLMYKKGVINGIGENNFGAQNLCTRAMAAQIIYTMLGGSEGADGTDNGIVTEDFEDNKWIFSGGYAEDETVKELVPGTVAYSGTGSVVFNGRRAATADAQGNRFFRIMLYDTCGTDTVGMDGVMMVEGDKTTYAIGAFTGKGALNNGLYYQCRAGDTWYETGVIKSVGWHEFIIDFSRSGYVDMYMDGVLVKSFEDEGTVPQRVVIGTTDAKATATIKCYGDDFVMAKSKKIYETAVKRNSISGNALIRTTPIDMTKVPENLRETVGLLHALNILPANSDGTLPLEEKITREEFIYLLSGMRNSSAADALAQKQYFSDVELDRWSAGYIESAVEYGFIKAEDSNFRPEESMNGTEAVKILLSLLGYSKLSEEYDTEWILDTASSVGITKGAAAFADALTWTDALKLCFNTLEATVLETNFKQPSAPEFEITDIIYLNYKFDVYDITGTVNGIYGREFSADTKLDENEMLIGSLVIDTDGKQVNELNGMAVKAYVYATEDDDDYRLVYIQDKGKSTALYIDAQDIISCKGGQISYEADTRNKEVKLSNGIEVIKNGAYLFAYDEADFMPEIGYVNLIDNDSDGVYDRAMIMEYTPIKVRSYNEESKMIYDDYTNKPIDLSEVENITRNGAGRVFPEILSANSVVLIAVSEDGTGADILDNTSTVSGDITGKSDGKIFIDNQEYHLADAFADYVERGNLDTLQIGVNGEFTVDMFGNVIGVVSANSQSSVYAYIVKTWTDDAGDGVYLKLFTDTGKFIDVPCSNKLTINDENGCTSKRLLDVESQLIRYKLNSVGELIKVEFADTTHMNSDELKGSDKFWLYQDTEVWYRSQYGFGASLYTKSSTPVMVVPADGDVSDTDRYVMSTSNKQFSDSKTYSYMAYSVNEFNYPDIIVLPTETVDKVKLPKNISKTRMFVVNYLTTVVDDAGDIRQKITGWESGKEVSYLLRDNVDFDQVKKNHGFETGWKMGDTFIAVTDEKDDLWEVYYVNSSKTNTKGYVHSENEDEYTDLSSFAYEMEKINCFYAKVDKFGDGIRFTDGNSYFITTNPLFGVYVVNRTAKTVEMGSTADLIPGRDAFVFAYHGKPYEVFVYVD